LWGVSDICVLGSNAQIEQTELFERVDKHKLWRYNGA
jgi:hypothetical protein